MNHLSWHLFSYIFVLEILLFKSCQAPGPLLCPGQGPGQGPGQDPGQGPGQGPGPGQVQVNVHKQVKLNIQHSMSKTQKEGPGETL